MVDIVDLRNLVAEAEGTTDERAAQKKLCFRLRPSFWLRSVFTA
jgi:hypothetical protein